MIMIDEYRINAGDIPRYELEILKAGICHALVPGAYYSENDTVAIVPDGTGYASLEKKLNSYGRSSLSSDSAEDGESVLGGFRLTLKMLRSIIEACRISSDYLIRPEDISLSVDDIYFTSDFCAGLLLKPGQVKADLVERILLLCSEIDERFPMANAGVIQEKISAANDDAGLDGAGLLRLLSRWEIELER